jgi:hypothetical protein
MIEASSTSIDLQAQNPIIPRGTAPEKLAGLHLGRVRGPAVEFVRCGWRNAETILSNDRNIRFRVFRWRGQIRFDADWFSTDLQLARHAAKAIQCRWTAELGLYPKRRRGGECGGLKSCLILDAAPEREMHWRSFLRRLLSDPASWWYFDWSVQDFCPSPVIALNIGFGNQP